MGDLTGKFAIVTGAASGIGRASAQLFAERGAHVLAVDRPESAIMDAHAGSKAIAPFAQSVTDEDAPEKIIESYYALHLIDKLILTADYQRVINPAYNQDRGPVSVYALRLHADF